MKRTGMIVIVMGLVAGLFGAGPGRAATAPTLVGPRVVAYYSKVTLTGTTPLPNEKVNVYLLRTVGTRHNTYELTSDSNGHFRLTYRATVDWNYFAYAGGVRSAQGSTRLVRATCTVSGPLFSRLIYPHSGDADFPEFASLGAERGGLWAGIENDGGGDFAVISWRSGQVPVVLGTFGYHGPPYQPGEPGLPARTSVAIVGITSAGGIVAAVQSTASRSGDATVGLVWVGRHRYRLAAPSGATSVNPVRVTNDGHIVGWARVGSGSAARYYVERWNSTGGSRQTILRIASGLPYIAVDGAGDIVYMPNNSSDLVRLAATGRSVPVQVDGEPSRGSTYLYLGGASSDFYGQSWEVLAKWDAARATSSVPVVKELAPVSDPVSVSNLGDLLFGYFPGRRSVLTHTGALVPMPRELSVDIGFPPTAFMTPGGSVAFTATDRRVHLMTCH